MDIRANQRLRQDMTAALVCGLLAALALAGPALAEGQTAALTIKVSDPAGSPVQATGELRGLADQTRIPFVTDAAGEFTFGPLPLGTYRLTLSRAGFAATEAIVEFDSAGPLERSLTLDLLPVATTVVVTILPDSLEGVPGSTDTITREDLDSGRPFSIKEALRRSPGVHVVDEDAFGLNLNIGMRGLNPRRTQRTLLLEDGAPVYLAPYSDPAAHYSTPLEMVDRVEFIKGSGQILHGPQTVGGVMNMVTEAPPSKFRTSIGAVTGNRGFRSFDGKAGFGGSRGGFLAHVVHREGDGVRTGHSHAITHLNVRGLLKLASRQSLQLQTSYHNQDSRFTEAGLTQERYETDPLGNAFDNDKFELQRATARAVHTYELTEGARLSTNFYYQKIDRASYRQIDFATDQMTANPDTGCVGAARRDYDAFAGLCGNKMRPRNYDFWGVEPRLSVRRQVFGLVNETNAGVRLHRENVTRRRFNGLTPAAREDSPGTLFRDWNEIETRAVPAYLQSSFFGGSWSVTPGVRVENIVSRNRARRFDFAPTDVRLRTSESIVLPGLGATYFGLPRTTVFAGVHRGFAPPRPDDNLDPTDPSFSPVSAERSTNYEAGVRSIPSMWLQAEITAFRLDFRNQIVPGASVGLPQLTWANGGRTLNEGYEAGARLDLAPLFDIAHDLYLTAAYTHLLTARFSSDEFIGPVNIRGNRLPYAPRYLFSPVLGYGRPGGFHMNVGLEQVGEQFTDNINTRAGSPDGMAGIVPGFTTVNASVNVPLRSKGLVLFVSGSNLADRRYIVSRVDGIHVGRPRQVFGGLRWDR